jgi:O-antigen/teichoic acid export membrane protein
MNYAYGEILATSGLQSLKNKLELGMLASNGVANLLLIPRFGAMGAGIAAVVAELVLFLLLVRTSPLRSRM